MYKHNLLIPLIAHIMILALCFEICNNEAIEVKVIEIGSNLEGSSVSVIVKTNF